MAARRVGRLAGRSVTWAELLEPRRLLAMVVWDGGPTGNGTSFTDPVNWAGDVLPGTGDAASISATGTSPEIIISASITVPTISSSRSLRLSSPTLSGTTVVFSGGATLLASSSGGRLNDVTITGDVVVPASANLTLGGANTFGVMRLTGSSSTVYFASGATSFTGTIQAEGAATGTRNIRLGSGGSGTTTIPTGSAIRLAAGTGGNLTISDSSVSSLVNGGTISAEAAARTLTVSLSGSSTNTGNAQAIAGTLAITSTTFGNVGTISANGATVTLGGEWGNTGTIAVTNSTLNLDGTFGIGSLGTLTRTGGTVNLTGTLNNVSSTLALNAATGSWSLSGGTINGGTVSYAGGSSLLITTNGGRLNGVTIIGDVVVPANANLTLGGANTFGVMRLTGSSSTVYFASGATSFTGTIQAEGAATGTRNIRLGSGGSGTTTIPAGSAIRLAAGTGGNLTISDSSVSSLVNGGTISAEAAARTLTVSLSGSSTNTGNAQAIAGTLAITSTTFGNVGTISANGATVTLGGEWGNTGTIAVTNSTLNLDGTFGIGSLGTLTRTGGTVNLTGTLNNVSSTLALNAATGSWSLSGGTINGGTVSYAGGSSLLITTNGGRLNGVTIIGDVVVPANANLTLGGANTFGVMRLTGSSSTVYFASGATSFTGTIQAEGAATGTRNIRLGSGGSGTTTIPAGSAIRLAAGTGGNLTISDSSVSSLVNGGTISAEAAARTLTVLTTTFANNGGRLDAPAGTLRLQQQANSLLRLLGMTIGESGRVETRNHNLLFDYADDSPIADLISYLVSERLVADADLEGLPTTLAASEAVDLGVTEFAGATVDETAVLLKYTYVGDANLDGQVDALDYERIDLAIGNTGVLGTAQGDLNYDGNVDALDYEQVDLNIGNGVGSPLGDIIVAPVSSSAGSLFSHKRVSPTEGLW
jgi:hypothetical protein